MGPRTFDFAVWASGFEGGSSSNKTKKKNVLSKRITRPKKVVAKDTPAPKQPPSTSQQHNMKTESFSTDPTSNDSFDGAVKLSELPEIESGVPVLQVVTGSVKNGVPTEVSASVASYCDSEITGLDVPELDTARQYIDNCEKLTLVDHQRIRDYCRNIMLKRSVMYGKKSIRTAEAILDYAHALYSCKVRAVSHNTREQTFSSYNTVPFCSYTTFSSILPSVPPTGIHRICQDVCLCNRIIPFLRR